MRLLLGVLLCLSAFQPVAADESSPARVSMKLLFCANGSIGIEPSMQAQPGFESQLAVAVVEVNTSQKAIHSSLPQVTLLYDKEQSASTKRVISAEVFDEPFVAGETNMAFYLNTDRRGHTHPWDETLPIGMVHLRVRVALAMQSSLPMPKACRVKIGPYMVEGPIDGTWPTN